MRRPLRRLALCAVFGLLVPLGCSSERDRSVRAPDAGVTLSYPLTVGTSLDGHLQIGTTRKLDGIATPLSQGVECDARLFVVKTEEDGSYVVRATFRNVELDWSVPPETGLSTDAFAKLAATTLGGTELRFSVSPQGKLTTLPAAPDRVPAELAGLFDTLGRGAALAFVELPTTPVKAGAPWTDASTAPGTPHNEVVFEGLTRRKADGITRANLRATFTSAIEVDTPSGPRRRQLDGETHLQLDEAGVPLSVKTQLRDFDPVRGTAVQAIDASWTRTDEGDASSTAVQDIDDPCDADYVGTAICPTAPE
jgi:hypothetical protein